MIFIDYIGFVQMMIMQLAEIVHKKIDTQINVTNYESSNVQIRLLMILSQIA